MKRRIWKEFRSLRFYTAILLAYPLIMAIHMASPFSFSVYYWDLPLFGKVETQATLDKLDLYIRQYYIEYTGFEFQFAYLVLLMAAVRIFGAEFEYGTLGRLLSQPITRRRIWLEKSAAFFLVVFVLLAAHDVCYLAVTPRLKLMEEASAAITHRIGLERGMQGYEGQTNFLSNFFLPVLGSQFTLFYISLLALSCGLTASLFIRKTYTAFWAALVFPLCAVCLVMVIDSMCLKGSPIISMINRMGREGINMIPFNVDSDINVLCQFIVLWSLIVYPLGWFKFKRLEV